MPSTKSIAADRYTSKPVFKRESSYLFQKSWLFMGHDSEFKPGYVFCQCLGNDDVFTIRQENRDLLTFYNYCRHRGTRLLNGRGPLKGAIKCPYHGWQYSKAGQPMGAGGQLAGSLLQLETRVKHGLVFARHSTGEGFESFLAPLSDILGRYSIESFAPIFYKELSVQCNWKAFIDAAIESYHVKSVHGGSLLRFFDLEHQQTSARGRHLFLDAKITNSLSGFLQRFLKPGKSRLTENDLALYRKFLIFPNTVLNLTPFFMSTYTVWPVTVERCLVSHRVYSRTGLPWLKTIIARLRNELARLLSNRILKEDISIVEHFQSSINDRVIARHRIHPDEEAVYLFHQQLKKSL